MWGQSRKDGFDFVCGSCSFSGSTSWRSVLEKLRKLLWGSFSAFSTKWSFCQLEEATCLEELLVFRVFWRSKSWQKKCSKAMLVFALFLRHVAFECYGCLFCSNAIGQHVMKISMCLIDRLSFFYNHLSHACMLLINWCVLHYYYYMLWTRSVIAQHSFSIVLFYTKTERRTVRMT